jgi:hypothetical protein
MAAWRAGKQLFLQGVIESSTLARSIYRQQWHQIDLAMKELSTWPSKHAGVLKRGLRPIESPEVIADVWIAWRFQPNFMYKPVL